MWELSLLTAAGYFALMEKSRRIYSHLSLTQNRPPPQYRLYIKKIHLGDFVSEPQNTMIRLNAVEQLVLLYIILERTLQFMTNNFWQQSF